MNPRDLRREGERLIEEALLAIDTGDVVRARELLARGQMRLEAAALLTTSEQAVTVDPMNAHALASSRVKAKVDDFTTAMWAAGYNSLRDLAEATGISHSMLSMARSGVRTLRPEKQELIKAKVGMYLPPPKKK